ncbi:MAG: DNA polymerase Y family protein [Christensenellales bacterium]|jgi:DNA polymerase-4
MERIILHADLNNFYAFVECIKAPKYKYIPMAVTGDPTQRHGIVLAKNQLAKAAGIKTGEVIWQARRKCPNLVCLPPRFGLYMHYSRRVREIYYRFTPKVEPFGLDEAWLDMTGTGKSAEEAAEAVRAAVKAETGLTISVGASFNKVFAKLGSDIAGPDEATLITRQNFRETVWPLAVEELLFVGRATKRKLNNIGVCTIGDLARLSPAVLRSLLGKCGETLGRFARGEDRSEVAFLGDTPPVKSIGNSLTPFRDLQNDEDAKQMFFILAESVSARLRDQGLVCSLVGISVRDCELHTFTRQSTLQKPTALSGEIARTALRLFRANYGWAKPVRSVGVWAGRLGASDGEVQLSCLEEDSRRAAEESLDRAVYHIRRRYGNRAVMRACVLGGDFRRADPKEENVIFPAGFYDKVEIPL